MGSYKLNKPKTQTELTKYNPAKTAIVLNEMKKLNPLFKSLEMAGISYWCYERWMNEVPEFKEIITNAVNEFDAKTKEMALSSIYKNMEKTWTCAAWYLERRWPKEFSLKYEHTGNIKMTFEFGNTGKDVNVEFTKSNLKEIEEYIPENDAELLKKQRKNTKNAAQND